MFVQAYNPQTASRVAGGGQSVSSQAKTKGLADDYYDEVGDAADRDKYYASVKDDFDTADGATLFKELHSLISKGTRDLGYSGARKELYSKVDLRPDGNLYYLYSGDGPQNEEDVTDLTRKNLPNYNCEHVVPQSWFNKRTPMKSDLHHLFTEEIQCNGSRGNGPLREVDDRGEKIVSCGIKDHGANEFEPNAGKGIVARATLYFITRHPGYVGDNNETKEADIEQLLKWNKEYPVSDFERHRNDTIEEVQGNRNPFIDFPELAEKVDFSAGLKG